MGDHESHGEMELRRLGLTWLDLKSKLSLDIGAGCASITEEGLSKGAEVIPIDKYPYLGDVVQAEERPLFLIIEKKGWSHVFEHMERIRQTNGKEKDKKRLRMVQGDSCYLPFRTGAFDIVMCHAGPLARGWDLSTQDLELSFKEAIRVLRHGGRLHITPFFPKDPEYAALLEVFRNICPSFTLNQIRHSSGAFINHSDGQYLRYCKY